MVQLRIIYSYVTGNPRKKLNVQVTAHKKIKVLINLLALEFVFKF